MEIRDFFITPLVIILVYFVAYFIRPYVSDKTNRSYFFPALTVKIIGAITVGIVYQFYYTSGDTFTYHTFGSRHVWQALVDSPLTGLKLLFADPSHPFTGMYKYSSQIYFFKDPPSYLIVKIASVFDLFTFSTYSATAVLFAVLSFSGMWMFFLTFYKKYPHLHQWLALAAFFIPSVFFWGSGILKDTITLASLGMATYMFYLIFFEKKVKLKNIILLVIALYFVFSIKKFILQAYLPAVILWVFASNYSSIRSQMLKLMLVPVLSITCLYSAYYAIVKVGEGDEKYSVQNLAKTAQVTAFDIRYWSGREAGSGYSLGNLDGSFGSMLRLAPAAINVSLFRPYLWEVNNPLMFMAALESLFFLAVVLYIIVKKKMLLVKSLSNPDILFALVFSITFAFAVGVSTFNFGTLVRYKIPMLPFFLLALVLMLDYKKSDKKFSELDSTE